MLDPSFKPTEVPGLPLKLVHRRVQHRVAATAVSTPTSEGANGQQIPRAGLLPSSDTMMKRTQGLPSVQTPGWGSRGSS